MFRVALMYFLSLGRQCTDSTNPHFSRSEQETIHAQRFGLVHWRIGKRTITIVVTVTKIVVTKKHGVHITTSKRYPVSP